MDQVRQRTKRNLPLTTPQLIEKLNPLLRGWGEYYKAAHVRTLFHVSTDGSCDAFGRIGSSDGATTASGSCRSRCCTQSTGWSTCQADSFFVHLGSYEIFAKAAYGKTVRAV